MLTVAWLLTIVVVRPVHTEIPVGDLPLRKDCKDSGLAIMESYARDFGWIAGFTCTRIAKVGQKKVD